MGKPTLLGKNWLCQVKLDWGKVFSITNVGSSSINARLEKLLSKHSELFEDSYQCMKGFEAYITMKDGAKPVFAKP